MVRPRLRSLPAVPAAMPAAAGQPAPAPLVPASLRGQQSCSRRHRRIAAATRRHYCCQPSLIRAIGVLLVLPPVKGTPTAARAPCRPGRRVGRPCSTAAAAAVPRLRCPGTRRRHSRRQSRSESESAPPAAAGGRSGPGAGRGRSKKLKFTGIPRDHYLPP